MPKLVMLIGPPGSGKSTLAKSEFRDCAYVNQDSQGKEGHKEAFQKALESGLDVVVDRMNYNQEQRARYAVPAIEKGYEIKLVVLHVPYDVCYSRCMNREGHETIKDETNAKSALKNFFTNYIRPTPEEFPNAIDVDIEYRSPTREKFLKRAIVCDLDGTLCNIDHRLHWVRNGKKDWVNFFRNIPFDTPNQWCLDLVRAMRDRGYDIVFASGRPSDYEEETENWLLDNLKEISYFDLYMRHEGDYRQDNIVKMNILDFELLPRYNILFVIDDRKQVVDMWRERGLVCLQCAEGNF